MNNTAFLLLLLITSSILSAQSLLIRFHDNPASPLSDRALPEGYVDEWSVMILTEDFLAVCMQKLHADLKKEEKRSALKKLARMIKVERVPKTGMIKVTADGEAAGAVIDAVRECFAEYHIAFENELMKRGVQSLEGEFLNQVDIVMEARKELTMLTQQYGIPFFEDQSLAKIGSTEMTLLHLCLTKLAEEEVALSSIKASQQAMQQQPGAEKDHPSHDLWSRKSQQLSLEQLSSSNRIESLKSLVNQKENNAVELSLKQHAYQNAVHTYNNSKAQLIKLRKRRQELQEASKIPRVLVTVQRLL